VGGNTTVQYVWSPVYVDALVLRDRDSDGDGTLDERLWVVQDANFNVTAVVDGSGEVVERYVYDPFGQATVLDAEWNVRSGGSAYDWLYLHQGGRYDVTSGLYHFRFRDYSPTLGRWTSLDPLSYAAGDVNLYRVMENRPVGVTDPLGLYTPQEAWKYLTEEQQRKWKKLEEQGWGLYQESWWWNPFAEAREWKKVGFDSRETVRVEVTDEKMLKMLLAGRDIQWVHDGWAVDFSHKTIWIDSSWNDTAGLLLGQIIDHLYDAGEASGWVGKDGKSPYDIDLLGKVWDKRAVEGGGKTLDSLKDNWSNTYLLLTDAELIPVESLTPQARRKIIMYLVLERKITFEAMQSMIEMVTSGKLGKAINMAELIKLTILQRELNKRP